MQTPFVSAKKRLAAADLRLTTLTISSVLAKGTGSPQYLWTVSFSVFCSACDWGSCYIRNVLLGLPSAQIWLTT